MIRNAWNPKGRFQLTEVEWDEPQPPAALEVIEDDTKGILSHNKSPDLGFSWSVNPYRGCTHACAYCYARSYHEYLGFGAGTDHDRKIVVKRRAAALLEAEFDLPAWTGERVIFSGVTDCYQPLERRYGLTRACLEVCQRYQNPVGVITRSPLVTRDLDLLLALQASAGVHVHFSIPLLDPVMAHLLEPGAPPPSARLKAMAALAAAGIPVGISLAPVIPGLNDHLIPAALEAAQEAGARTAFMTLVRLSGTVAAVFESRLREQLPDRADRVMNGIRRARGGALNNSRFGERHKGEGPAWAVTEQLFRVWTERLGLNAEPTPAAPPTFRRPWEARQLSLFGAASPVREAC